MCQFTGLLAQVAAVDLVEQKLLWRRRVETKGLLNIVAAPQVSQGFPPASGVPSEVSPFFL